MTKTSFFGVDFTSRPTSKKPIIRALARLTTDGFLDVYGLETAETFAGFEAWLEHKTPWVAGFDYPFSLPQEYVAHLGWPTKWEALMQTVSAHSREQLRTFSKAFCDSRAVGNKFAHRLCDVAAGSSSSMKWVNPPVLYMLLEGAPRLAVRDINIPGLRGSATAIGTALEAYPGYLARALIGNISYKSDDKAKQNDDREAARGLIIGRLLDGFTDVRLVFSRAPQMPVTVLSQEVADAALADASGDCLDAILCVIQAAMAWQLRDVNWGVPYGDKAFIQRVAREGWIAGVPKA